VGVLVTVACLGRLLLPLVDWLAHFVITLPPTHVGLCSFPLLMSVPLLKGEVSV
jgi:hypothetical protein